MRRLILLLLLPCLMVAFEWKDTRPRLLCSATAASLHGGFANFVPRPRFGLSDAQLAILDLGAGIGTGNTGLLLSARLLEAILPSGYAGDYMGLFAIAPVYLHAFHKTESSMPRVTPTLHLYVGGAHPRMVMYEMGYLQVGAGAEWQVLWVIRPSVQIGWRHVWGPPGYGPSHVDFFTAGLQLDIGYRWTW